MSHPSLHLPDRFTSRPAESTIAGADPCQPSDEAVHQVHDLYLHEVVEALNICPFARRSRELGHVARELLRGGDATWLVETAASRLRVRASDPHVWEIVLLTFPASDEPTLSDPLAFEDFHRRFRLALAEAPAIDRVYYSVCFHPALGEPPVCDRNAAAFVGRLRRAPDPLIQCVHAPTLDRVRKQAQEHAHSRMKKSLQAATAAMPPELAHLVDRAVLTDSELSSEIAEQNFSRYSTATGRAQLEAALAKVARLRARLYAPLAP